MSKFDSILTILKSRLRRCGGLDIESALREFGSAFAPEVRSEEEKQEWRTSLKYKVLREEVSPTLFFLEMMNISTGAIRFAFDSSVPDAWLKSGDTMLGIEITQALGTEQAAKRKTLNSEGIAPGFAGKQDSSFFEHYPMAKREAYSTLSAYEAVRQAIAERISRKSDKKFNCMALLISAPLNSLPEERWACLRKDLSQESATSPFKLIVALDEDRAQPPIFLKGRGLEL